MRIFGRSDPLKRSLKCPLRVGLNPALPTHLRHGTVWFEVSGFGRIKRHFLVNDPDLLIEHARRLALHIARQVMLLDASLPKREELCQPVRIDIVGTSWRRIYDLPTFHLILEQPL